MVAINMMTSHVDQITS